MLGAAWLSPAGIAVGIATIVLTGWHLEPGMLIAVSAPACIAAWRAGAWMRPAAP